MGINIAIDGPAGAGKSTIAKKVAKVMLNHLENTGEASGELFSEKLETEIIAGKSVRVFA